VANKTSCSHAGCSCDLQEPHAVVQGGKAFCSDGCAAGQGCSHGNCNCRPGTQMRSD